ncbi:MlaD family protein [Hippea maritima]|uniref:Mammalian cell entry related domain protein n=1 Tax=Hippea maritima (strain ATCC 700847 / DSM 10411 / MH2) TaxID=760142 RepID=F2LVU5_HIPMA|nr:MlaD family protein [Hippea maritima]AEA33879.1 Mammalian cell entry related domain protein [Hippea maritima DSM 10411]
MEPKVNYALVGIFVIIFSIIGIGIVLWLIGGSNYTNYKRYIVYTNSNISGLHVDSDVKYKGLSVGKVEDILIDQRHPDFFKIIILIERNLPLKANMAARISSNGLTGISYINLIYTNNPPKLPGYLKNEPYPVIGSIPSNIEEISSVIMETADSLKSISNKINVLLDNSTENNIKHFIKNSNDAAAQLALAANHLNQTLSEVDRLVSLLTLDTKQIAVLLSKFDALSSSVSELIGNSNKTLNYFRDTSLQKSYEVLIKIKSLLTSTKEFVDELKYNPSLLIDRRKEGKQAK